LNFNWLSTILFLPAVGAIAIALFGKREKAIRPMAIVFTAVPLILALYLFITFDRSGAMAGTMQFEENYLWIAPVNAFYHLGVDGLSMPLLLLTAFLGFLAVLISWKVHLRAREFFAWLLLLEASIIGVFVSLDLLLFFIMWEIEVIPMYFLISVWGSGRKGYSATKYVIYTLFGSALMLAGILCVYFTTGSLNMIDIANQGLGVVQTAMPAAAIFWLLFIGFAVKLPMFPLHTWLPDAHTDAPTAVSVMLAGVLIKMGGYGIMRLCVSMFPAQAQEYAQILIVLALIGIIYGAAVTLLQTDIKRMIAYSSISHMGYVLLGIFALGQVSMTGAALQMFSHGIVTGLLFAVAGLVIHNVEVRDLRQLGGLARQVPVITAVFVIAGLASLGLPLTSGFAAEFLVFLGSYTSPVVAHINVYTIIAISGVVLTAGYILWMIQQAFYGPVKPVFDKVKDADKLEKVYMFVLVAVIFLVGIYPAVMTNVFSLGVDNIVRLIGIGG
jgi:NADH-quinone oxidoreductase subunit M